MAVPAQAMVVGMGVAAIRGVVMGVVVVPGVVVVVIVVVGHAPHYRGPPQRRLLQSSAPAAGNGTAVPGPAW